MTLGERSQVAARRRGARQGPARDGHDTSECDLAFVEHVLSGVSASTPEATRLLRAGWIVRNLPRTASLIGIDGESL